MKKKYKILISISSALMILMIGSSLAVFTSKDEQTNKFTTGDNDIKIEEEFTPNENWDGQEHKKVVKISNVTNNKKSAVLVRVSIIPRWIDDSNKEVDGNLNTNLVQLNFSNIVDNKLEKDKWIDGKDGYYYYTSLLEAGASTSKILNSVKLNFSSDEEKANYENKTLMVDVNSESIQPTIDAYRTSWNITEDTEIDKMLKSLVEARK